MASVAARELRNDTSRVLRRVENGEVVVVTLRGRPVAQLTALPSTRRRWLPGRELVARLRTAQADPALREDLARVAGDTTDDLGPIE